MNEHYFLNHFILRWCIFISRNSHRWELLCVAIAVTVLFLHVRLWFLIEHFFSIRTNVLFSLNSLSNLFIRGGSFLLDTISIRLRFIEINQLVFNLLKSFFEKCTYFVYSLFCFISDTFFLFLLVFRISFLIVLRLLWGFVQFNLLLLILTLSIVVITLVIVWWSLSALWWWLKLFLNSIVFLNHLLILASFISILLLHFHCQ